jgi:hypothetical protein
MLSDAQAATVQHIMSPAIATVTLRWPTSLDALPAGYVCASVRYTNGAVIEGGIAPDGRMST